MFTKIDIKKFGLYKDFKWPNDLQPFGRLNIIYGRNYQGKTTLSRIFDSVGQGKLHPDYMDGEFTLYGEGCTVDEDHLECPYHVRVYNSDFVRRNLSWLNDEKGGDIAPFALLGSINKAAQEEIDRQLDELGDVEKKTGLRYEYFIKNEIYEKSNKELEEAKTKLENQLTRLFEELKINPYFIGKSETYNVNSLRADIENLKFRKAEKTWDVLSRSEKEKLMQMVDEQWKPVIGNLPKTGPNLREFIKKTLHLVNKQIRISKPLGEQIESDLFEAWVNQGREVNKGRETCAFCGSPISKERWRLLNMHFNKESDKLSDQLHRHKQRLVMAMETIDNYLEARGFVDKNIYIAYSDEYVEVMNEWLAYVHQYKKIIKDLLGLIDLRLRNLFMPLVAKNVYEEVIEYSEVATKINKLIEKNNAYGRDRKYKRNEARYELRLQEVEKFCQEINYYKEQKRLDDEELKMMDFAATLGLLSEHIKGKETLIKMKELEKMDESRAAKMVTNLMTKHFGNSSLSLESELPDIILKDHELETPKHTRFVIKRGGVPAKNLSEGEKSLIAFCYFIAQMEDELSRPDAGKTVVYIDDPISSLDNSHIYFMYSLIDTMIARPTKFGQLFISTHNLEFLRLIKNLKLSGPKGSKTRCHYVVVKLGISNFNNYKSEIRKMPEYLSKYTTEYNFLFEQIYEVAVLNSEEEQELYGMKYTQYYNIGNNMRKFLECYLFNRYPDTDDPLSGHIGQLFDGHLPSEVNRVVNEYSHLKWAERGMKVMDAPEVVTAAKEIIKALKTKDPEHFAVLCKSVGKDVGITLS